MAPRNMYDPAMQRAALVQIKASRRALQVGAWAFEGRVAGSARAGGAEPSGLQGREEVG